MEKDDEMKGKGNSLDFGARVNDPRLGRWLSLDPLANKYPGTSAYVAFADNPVLFVDPDGRLVKVSKDDPNVVIDNSGGKWTVKMGKYFIVPDLDGDGEDDVVIDYYLRRCDMVIMLSELIKQDDENVEEEIYDRLIEDLSLSVVGQALDAAKTLFKVGSIGYNLVSGSQKVVDGYNKANNSKDLIEYANGTDSPNAHQENKGAKILFKVFQFVPGAIGMTARFGQTKIELKEEKNIDFDENLFYLPPSYGNIFDVPFSTTVEISNSDLQDLDGLNEVPMKKKDITTDIDPTLDDIEEAPLHPEHIKSE
jgi:RHS repeat-associated protein